MTGILVDWQIKELCEYQGMVVPFDKEMVNPCSIDIRVGESAQLRVLGGWKDIDLRQFSEGNPYWLNPGDRVLVASLETFYFPDNIAGQFRLKSSRGREFYEHLESGWCEPGWHGSKLTMELIAHDIEPLPLYQGLRMGQIIFFRLAEVPNKSYGQTGRYNNDTTVQQSKG